MPSHMFTMTFEKLDTPDVYCNYKYESVSLKLRGSLLIGGLWKLSEQSDNRFFIVSGKQMPNWKIKYSAHKCKL